MTPCRSWASGSCRHGEQCWFLHSFEAQRDSAISGQRLSREAWCSTPYQQREIEQANLFSGKRRITAADDCDSVLSSTPVDAGASAIAAAESAANQARNAANIQLLLEWYPEYCSYELYWHHVRGSTKHRCTHDATGAGHCSRGSHLAPAGLALKGRLLDLSHIPA